MTGILPSDETNAQLRNTSRTRAASRQAAVEDVRRDRPQTFCGFIRKPGTFGACGRWSEYKDPDEGTCPACTTRWQAARPTAEQREARAVEKAKRANSARDAEREAKKQARTDRAAAAGRKTREV